MNLEKVKIVVVGDSGVGKSSLVHLITHHEVLKKACWTIGCSVEAKLHEFKDGTVQHKTYFIEFYDIGGYSAHKPSARMFYAGVDGVILVHDLTNVKSQENLKYWLNDVLCQNELASSDFFSGDSLRISGGGSPSSSPVGSMSGGPVLSKAAAYDSALMPPLVVIGTKLDQAQLVRDASSLRSASPIAMHFRADEINLDCMQVKYLAPATSNSIKLAKFLDRVIEHKLTQVNRELYKDKPAHFYSTIQSEKAAIARGVASGYDSDRYHHHHHDSNTTAATGAKTANISSPTYAYSKWK